MSLSSLWATGLLNYLQCSASLFRLAQSQVCFSAELLKPTASGEPWPLISELLSTVLVLSKTNSCYNKPKFCAVKSFHSGIRKCHVNRGDYLCMFLPRPWSSWADTHSSSSDSFCGLITPQASGSTWHSSSSTATENGDWVCTSLDVLTRALEVSN